MSEQITFPRDLKVDVRVNPLGFMPNASKKCVVSAENTEFHVIQLEGGKELYCADLHPSDCDFGKSSVGDFSKVEIPGTYYIKTDKSRSYPFRINSNVYDDVMQMIVRYFSRQRCGASTTGYLAPCHLDDGIRLDNGKHQDVTGGWHDASDLRKWVGATIYGMIGLARLYEVLMPTWDHGQIMDELLWGNRYFLNMQEPAGYVMSHVGGDVLKHGDSNRWTDNIIGDENGSAITIKPKPGGSSGDITIAGAKDDRVIQTNPLDRLGQYNFVITEAIMARLTKQIDPIYSEKCLTSASRCFDWCIESGSNSNAGHIGIAIESAIELYKATGTDRYLKYAIDHAKLLSALQIKESIASDILVRGFYITSQNNQEPYLNIWNGCWHIMALCDLVEISPDHSDASQWKEAIALYAQDYLLTMTKRNNFGIVPYGFFSNGDIGGNRQIGNFWYRYFMKPVNGWWVGINANLASAGVGLARAAKVLQDSSLLSISQRQLDWILGFNPHGASTMEGVGYNHPKQFVNGDEFSPATPRIPGAVMNGLGGTLEDQPALYDGSYNTAEYWTPMVAYTLWLMAELSM
jgi:hypothetical protein